MMAPDSSRTKGRLQQDNRRKKVLEETIYFLGQLHGRPLEEGERYLVAARMDEAKSWFTSTTLTPRNKRLLLEKLGRACDTIFSGVGTLLRTSDLQKLLVRATPESFTFVRLQQIQEASAKFRSDANAMRFWLKALPLEQPKKGRPAETGNMTALVLTVRALWITILGNDRWDHILNKPSRGYGKSFVDLVDRFIHYAKPGSKDRDSHEYKPRQALAKTVRNHLKEIKALETKIPG